MKYLGVLTQIFKKKRSKIESEKRGRPSKGISDLTQKQVEILLKPNLTCREKAAELNMSVGWVAKWDKKLREELGRAFLSRQRK